MTPTTTPTPSLVKTSLKNSLIKNIFEEEISLKVEHKFFLENSPLLDVFWPSEDFKLTTELSEKVQYFRNQATKNKHCLCQ